MLDIFNPARLLYMTPAVIIGLTVHEYSHALAAYSLGDRTAYHAGRLTLNPFAHIDILGLIMLYFAGFGWAKPVPINPYQLRGDRKRATLLVSLAGPLSNFIMAVAGAALLGAFLWNVPFAGPITREIIRINVILAIFNLIPIPPLDGSKILAGLLPGSSSWLYSVEQYGTIILVLLLFTGIIGRILNIFIYPVYGLLNWVAAAMHSLL